MQPPSKPDSILTTTGTAGNAPAVPVSSSRRRGAGIEPWLYLAPGLLIFTAFMALPTPGLLVLSATACNGVSWDTAAFEGCDNCVRAIQDARLRAAVLGHSEPIPCYVPLPALLGIIPAALTRQVRLQGGRGFQAGLFLPYIMPGVLLGVVGAWLLNP